MNIPMTKKQMTAQDLDAIVEEIAERQTKPIIDASILDIVSEVEKQTGHKPSTSFVWASLRRIGAKSSGHRWVYRHNAGHE